MCKPYHTISIYADCRKSTVLFCIILYYIIHDNNLLQSVCIIRHLIRLCYTYHIHTTYMYIYALLPYHVKQHLAYTVHCKQITCYTILLCAVPCVKFSLFIPLLCDKSVSQTVYPVDADCLPHCIVVVQ